MPSEIHAMFDMHAAGVPEEVRSRVVQIIRHKNLTKWSITGEMVHVGGNEFLLANHKEAVEWLNNDCAWEHKMIHLGDVPWLIFLSFRDDKATTEFCLRWK